MTKKKIFKWVGIAVAGLIVVASLFLNAKSLWADYVNNIYQQATNVIVTAMVSQVRSKGFTTLSVKNTQGQVEEVVLVEKK